MLRRSALKKVLIAAAACAISTSAAAFPTDQQGLPIYSKLPKEVRDTAASVRASCKEAFHDEEPPKFDEWQGIHIVDLKGDGSDDIVVDHEHLCDSRMAGFNCSNRACELEIYKQVGKGKWRKVFSEDLYDKHLVIDWETNRLQMMIASIFYGDPRCQPDPKKEYTSGKSCNLIVTYRNGKWNWQKIPQRCCSAIKMTGAGQTRSFGDVGFDVRFAQKRIRLGERCSPISGAHPGRLHSTACTPPVLPREVTMPRSARACASACASTWQPGGASPTGSPYSQPSREPAIWTVSWFLFQCHDGAFRPVRTPAS